MALTPEQEAKLGELVDSGLYDKLKLEKEITDLKKQETALLSTLSDALSAIDTQANTDKQAQRDIYDPQIAAIRQQIAEKEGQL